MAAPSAAGQPIRLPASSQDPSICAVSPSRPLQWSPPGWDAPGTSESPLKLLQVHYFVRHGERTPVRTRLTNSKPPIPSRWDLCHVGANFKATVLEATGSHHVRADHPVTRGVEHIEKDKRTEELQGECLMGELTDLGRLSTLTLGRQLREVYINRLGLLPLTLQQGQDDGKVYVRSTNISRTIESAQQIIRGLLSDPSTTQASSSSQTLTPKILIRNGNVENLLPNTYSCPTLFKLDALFSRTVATTLNPSLAKHDQVFASQLGGALPRVDGHPRLSGILDTARAATAHGFDVPTALKNEQIKQELEEAVCSEWFYGYTAPDESQREQYRRLAMGPLLSDLGERLRAKVAGKDPLAMAIYSTREFTPDKEEWFDTSVTRLLTLLYPPLLWPLQTTRLSPDCSVHSTLSRILCDGLLSRPRLVWSSIETAPSVRRSSLLYCPP